MALPARAVRRGTRPRTSQGQEETRKTRGTRDPCRTRVVSSCRPTRQPRRGTSTPTPRADGACQCRPLPLLVVRWPPRNPRKRRSAAMIILHRLSLLRSSRRDRLQILLALLHLNLLFPLPRHPKEPLKMKRLRGGYRAVIRSLQPLLLVHPRPSDLGRTLPGVLQSPGRCTSRGRKLHGLLPCCHLGATHPLKSCLLNMLQPASPYRRRPTR